LTPNIARYIAKMCERSRAASKMASRSALYHREEAKDNEYDTWAENVLSN
jgi:hypothetical protein